ncbi:protein rolling stone-like [Acanthaster planci]|uniref:Protein rolling stone-like n=1 Tax=Acanthaster planci TaxID=133434 RepID=A0A8B7ZQM7_ACAPL|nr:protein rolling stone-like [Acanthaster planci]
MAMTCCERPKVSDFGLGSQESGVFHRTQWKKFPHVVFVAYRVILALYLLGILIAYLIQQINFFGGQAFVYLTNLGFIVFFIYVVLAGIVAVVDGAILKLFRTRNSEDANTCKMRIRHKMQWMFFNITINTNILVTIIYWGALYNPNFPFFYDFHVHTFTTIVSLIDLFLMPIPVRFLHFIYPIGFDLAYMALTVIFWAAGGRTISSTGAIYPFIDYSNAPGVAAGVIVGIFVAVIIMHGLIWALYKLRVWIWLRCGNEIEAVPTEADQDLGKMEEGL